jgi:hypothetical protein
MRVYSSSNSDMWFSSASTTDDFYSLLQRLHTLHRRYYTACDNGDDFAQFAIYEQMKDVQQKLQAMTGQSKLVSPF